MFSNVQRDQIKIKRNLNESDRLNTLEHINGRLLIQIRVRKMHTGVQPKNPTQVEGESDEHACL